MKTADVKVGGTYLTRIGDSLSAVVVTGEAHRTFSYATGKEGAKRFYVRRVGESGHLPKPRSAAALRPLLSKTYNIKDQPLKVVVNMDFHADGTRGCVVDVTFEGKELPRIFTDIKHPQEAAVRAVQAHMARAIFGE